MGGLLILSAGAVAAAYAERLGLRLAAQFEVDATGTPAAARAGAVLLVVGPDATLAEATMQRLQDAVLYQTPVLILALDGAKLDVAALPNTLAPLDRAPALSSSSAELDWTLNEVARILERLMRGEPPRTMRGRRRAAVRAPRVTIDYDVEKAPRSEPPPAPAAQPAPEILSAPPPSLEPAPPRAPAAAEAAPEPVLLGASAPRSARPGDEFTARFVAYVQDSEQEVRALLDKLSARSETHLALQTCRWQPGTEVTVKLAARGLLVTPAEQKFVWEGARSLVEFDVEVPEDAAPGTLVLKFDAFVHGVTVAKLRVDLDIVREAATVEQQVVRGSAARTAFASYSSQDRQRVLDRLAAVRISAGLDVFLDCLSLRPGEQWKPELERQIRSRDLFLLFWSNDAAASQWVSWEWQTALQQRGEEAMQIHPLEVGIAPPEALKHLHFGDPLMLIRAASRPG
jgi:hypothetical protein